MIPYRTRGRWGVAQQASVARQFQEWRSSRKAEVKLATTRGLIERTESDNKLRRLCGGPSARTVPSDRRCPAPLPSCRVCRDFAAQPAARRDGHRDLCMTRHSKKRGKSYQQLLPGGLAGENVFTRALRCWLRGYCLSSCLRFRVCLRWLSAVDRSARSDGFARRGVGPWDLGNGPSPSLVDPPSFVPASWMGCKGWTRIIARIGARER